MSGLTRARQNQTPSTWWRMAAILHQVEGVWFGRLACASCFNISSCSADHTSGLEYALVVVVFFTLTDRASTIPNNTRGCQSGTWSAGQKKIRGTSTKLQ